MKSNKHRRTGLTKNTGDAIGPLNPCSDANVFICIYHSAAKRAGVVPSASWLNPIIENSWFKSAIQRVVSRRRRHAPRVGIVDLQNSLTARFTELISVDPWLGKGDSDLQSLLVRIEKRMDSCARHLFPKENRGQCHRPRKKKIVRHIESSAIPRFDPPSHINSPLQNAIANECIGAVALALASLSVAERLVQIATYYEKQSVREISITLGVSRYRVMQLRKRGFLKLQLELKGFDD